MKIRVAFLVRRLDRGGAEGQLIELARGLNKERFDVTILTFYAGGDFASTITPSSGISVICLDKTGSWDIAGFLSRLIRTTRRLKPDIVHGYMIGANELSVVAGRACSARVVWGVRASDLRPILQSLGARCLFRVGALLSSQADRIIINSECGRSFHAAEGYCEDRLTVIANGIDTKRFSISPEQRRAVRREWSVGDEEILIGRAARFDLLKDYPSFLSAAARVSRVEPRARFVCIGDGTDCAELHHIATAEGVADRMIWAGGRADMPAVYNALDVCVSSSISEGFPNAVAEPMACGVPCVATDVGDSALIVGDAGIIVPAGNPEALADGILRLVRSHWEYPRERVRQRITDNFTVERLIASTEAAFDELLAS
jgi:glycosyltransferase involved in cell wall biosynthesis